MFEYILYNLQDRGYSEEESKTRNNKFKKMLENSKDQDKICLLDYGARGRSCELTRKDMRDLEPGAYLNDNVIKFHLMFIHHFVIEPALRDRTYIFDP